MSQRIYLDDCANSRELARLLIAAGHQVVIPADVGLRGEADDVHFRYAQSQGLVLLTKNPKDFEHLHRTNPSHPGIFAIYQDNDPDRDMKSAEIVRAISNLENGGVTIPNSFHILNAWRY